jgi:hypothetical protein
LPGNLHLFRSAASIKLSKANLPLRKLEPR